MYSCKRVIFWARLPIVIKNIIAIANETYINAESVCVLLQLIADQNIGIPIKIILDNAKYQRCELVENFAKSLKIDLVFLPSYSPNFNLIERLWKFTKKKCLYGKHYKNFKDFKERIDSCLSKVGNEYKSEISTLITTNFQQFQDAKEQKKLEKAA